MLHERVPLSPRERGHAPRVGVLLVLEKYREIALEHVPQHRGSQNTSTSRPCQAACNTCFNIVQECRGDHRLRRIDHDELPNTERT
jgi:hypothetical protein